MSLAEPQSGPVDLDPPQTRAAESVGQSLAFLSGSTAIGLGSGFVISIVLRAILGPAKAGIWNLVEVWRQQLSSVTVGAAQAADREMPILRARGEYEKESEVRSVAFSFTLGEGGAVGLGFLVYWAINRETFDPSLALGLALVPLMAVLTSYVSLYHLFLKNLKQFRLYSVLTVLQFALDWITVPLVLLGGLNAMLIGLAAGWVLRAWIHYVAVRRGEHFHLKLRVRRAVLVPLLRFGFMLSLVGLLTQLSLRLDSLVIGLSLGTTDLGYYFVGPQVAAAAAAVPLSLTVIAWPNLMTTYGRSGNEGLLQHLERYIRPIALVVSPLVTALAVFGIPVLVNGFIPAFAPGLGAMKVFILSVIFVHSVTLLQQVLIATRRVLLLLALVGLGVAVQAAILIVGSRGGLALETAAWSAVAGQAAIALGLLVGSGRLLEIGRADLLRFWLRVPLGWAAALALILGLDAVAPATHGLLRSLGVGAAQTVAFVVLGALVLRFVDRVALRESRALLRGFG